METENNKKVSSIYVGNVPWKATKDEISMLISAKANIEVTDVRIIKEKGTGRSRGFAFVDIIHADPEKFIQDAPEFVLEGRTLTLNFAKERMPKENELPPLNENLE